MLCSPTLSDVVIHELARSCYHLSLDGLTFLSVSAAQALTNHVGELLLDGLTSLDPDVANLLSENQGSVYRIASADSSISGAVLPDTRPMKTAIELCHLALPRLLTSYLNKSI
jgi:hypothetical protein